MQPDLKTVQTLCGEIKCNPIVGIILMNRRIFSPTDVSRFFSSSFKDLRAPFSIKDMDTAVRRIHTAITTHEKILIFGDYDVDGITATTLLYQFLQYTGADVTYYIPHRVREGYSLQAGHISDYVLPNKIRLIITVDCGSKSHEAVIMAQNAGTDVIITDHHTLSEELPPAVAVVNPKRPDCTAGFETLAGVGVAYCLLISLRKHLREMNFWTAPNRPEPNLKYFCDLVALGTVADVVPLVNENRIFSKTGLEILNTTKRPGIRALVKACGIRSKMTSTDDILFRLAPRLNAAGRIGHAKTAVSLLTTDDSETAKKISSSLNHVNQERKRIEKKIYKDILEYVNLHPEMLRQHSLVLTDPGWHEGVIGIVASKIVEKYYRPVILISTRNGIGKGSGRSIPGFDLHNGLVACADDLEYFGGHSMAAGLTIKAENISRFRKHFEKAVRKKTTPSDFLQTVLVDYELGFDEISGELIDALESLEPYGEGNPEPLFMTRNVKVLSSEIVGGSHRRMTLKQVSEKPGRPVNAIHFNIDTDARLREHFHQIAFRLRWNRWNGRQTAQIIIEET